jgi:hypothetical protein
MRLWRLWCHLRGHAWGPWYEDATETDIRWRACQRCRAEQAVFTLKEGMA